jgi:hypothetical protein
VPVAVVLVDTLVAPRRFRRARTLSRLVAVVREQVQTPHLTALPQMVVDSARTRRMLRHKVVLVVLVVAVREQAQVAPTRQDKDTPAVRRPSQVVVEEAQVRSVLMPPVIQRAPAALVRRRPSPVRVSRTQVVVAVAPLARVSQVRVVRVVVVPVV